MILHESHRQNVTPDEMKSDSSLFPEDNGAFPPRPWRSGGVTNGSAENNGDASTTRRGFRERNEKASIGKAQSTQNYVLPWQ
jgi:hypothetical protein